MQRRIASAIELLEEVADKLHQNRNSAYSEADLTALDLQVAFPKMRESEVKFVLSILRRHGQVATDSDISSETGMNLGSIKVYASNCRSYFCRSGIEPSIVRVRRTGYRMSPDALAAIVEVARG